MDGEPVSSEDEDGEIEIESSSPRWSSGIILAGIPATIVVVERLARGGLEALAPVWYLAVLSAVAVALLIGPPEKESA